MVPTSEGVIIAIIGVFSVVLAQSISELVKKFLNRTAEKDTGNLGIRDELRLEIARKDKENELLRVENKELDAERDRWKMDYFKLYIAFVDIKTMVQDLLRRHPDANIELPVTPPRSEDDE